MSTATPDSPSVADEPVGTVLAGRYRLDAVIGTGGMATVYRATDESLGRTVAIKLLRRNVADADDVRRQSEEIHLVASLSHSRVVTLFDAVADDADNRAFLVLQYVDGPDLRERLREGQLSPELAASIGADVAEALEYVHDKGVIHRDLKPGNILLHDEGGRTRGMLTDFGIARLVDGSRFTVSGSVLGTAAFMSPEQASGAVLTPASDVYSLGLVLLEAITGQRTFAGPAIESAVARLSSDPPIPDDLSPAWADLLRRMTAREPAERPSAAEAAARMRALIEEEPDPTLVLPASPQPDDVQTERMASPATAAPAPIAPTERMVATPPDTAARPKSRRVVVAILIAIATAAVVTVSVWAFIVQSASPPSGPDSVDYPAVDGDLGVSLESLQRSVEP